MCMCVCVCACTCMSTHICTGMCATYEPVPTDLKREMDLLELELQAFVIHPTWLLGTRLGCPKEQYTVLIAKLSFQMNFSYFPSGGFKRHCSDTDHFAVLPKYTYFWLYALTPRWDDRKNANDSWLLRHRLSTLAWNLWSFHLGLHNVGFHGHASTPSLYLGIGVLPYV